MAVVVREHPSYLMRFARETNGDAVAAAMVVWQQEQSFVGRGVWN